MDLNKTLKTKAKTGVIWSAIESFSVQGLQVLVGVILARILSPKEFGLIGMLAIFFSISHTLINSGMASGLIQKNNRTKEDYSTVFVFNLIVSVFIYLILFFGSSWISEFFNEEQLVELTRVVSLVLIVNALAVVQRTLLVIDLDFKTIAQVNLTSTLISGCIAIYFAYSGWGTWALAIQMLLKSMLTTCGFWIVSRWDVSLIFNRESFKKLFGFGSKLLLAGLYAQLLNNVYNIAIGRKFPPADLGYYTRGKQFADLSSGTITAILQQVTFPLLASVKDDKVQMVSIYKKVIQLTAFIIFPSMALLSLLAEPLVNVLLGPKWYGVIPLLQWIAIARIITPLSVINMSILNAMGRSDLFLKLDLAKFPLIALALFISIPLGVEAMIIAQVVTTFIAFFMNAYLPGKFFGYGAMRQLKDMFSIMVATVIMVIGMYFLILFVETAILKLIVGGITGLVVYLTLTFILKVEGMRFLLIEFKRLRN